MVSWVPSSLFSVQRTVSHSLCVKSQNTPHIVWRWMHSIMRQEFVKINYLDQNQKENLPSPLLNIEYMRNYWTLQKVMKLLKFQTGWKILSFITSLQMPVGKLSSTDKHRFLNMWKLNILYYWQQLIITLYSLWRFLAACHDKGRQYFIFFLCFMCGTFTGGKQ